MRQEFTRVAVKVGSNVLTRRDGTLGVTCILAPVDQIAELRKSGVEIILISPGAVASGHSEVHPQKELDNVDQHQLLSAVGQAKLVNRYYKLLCEYSVPVSQASTTRGSFGVCRHYLSQKNCMTVIFENNVIPIVNEGDTIPISEPMFAGNDELSGLITPAMDTQALIILGNIDGIYNGSPSDPNPSVIREVGHGKDLSNYIQTIKSSFGRGGILTRANIIRKVADEGITVVIANGERDDILVDLSQRPEETLHTRFISLNEPVSNVKRWIVHSEGFAKEEIHINGYATEALNSEKAVSILPIGIIHIGGEFEKDDIVCIMDLQGDQIGVGKVNCDSKQVQEATGKHGKKPVVHYGYLYVE